MANANSKLIDTSLDRLKVRDHCWGKSYRGDEADLVAAGLVKPEWFPGKPGNPKQTVQVGMMDGTMKVIPYLSMPDHERKKKTSMTIFKEGKKFRAYIGFTEEERDRIKVKEKMEKLHAEKKQKLESAPKNPDDFLRKNVSGLKYVLEMVLNNFRRADNGYHYSREVVEEAGDLICDLYALAERGKVYFDPKRQQYFLDDLEAKTAEAATKEFPEFSAFMATTLAIGKAAL